MKQRPVCDCVLDPIVGHTCDLEPDGKGGVCDAAWVGEGGAVKIRTVEYRRLRTFGSYQNETVGAVAEIEAGQSPEITLNELRAWVDGQLGSAEEGSGLRERVSELRFEATRLERRIEAANEKWSALMAFLEKLGIERPADIPDTLEGLPF